MTPGEDQLAQRRRSPGPTAWFTTCMCTVFLALVAVACGARAASPEALPFSTDGDDTVLTVWTWGGTGHELLIDSFERDHPGVRVDLVISEFVQHHDGLKVALEAGVAVPDVALIERDFAPEFVVNPETFTDLRQYGADELADGYLPWRWAEGTAGEMIVGMPTDLGGLALAYRTELFEEAGLPTDPDEVADLVATWDGFLATGGTYVDSGAPGTFVDSVDSVYVSVVNQYELGYVDADGEPALYGPGSIAAWDLTVRSIESGLTGPYQQFTPEWNQAIATGDFAMVVAPSWMRSYLAGISPDSAGEWGLVPVPGTVGNWGGSHLTIPAGAEHPDLAWELVEHLSNADAQLELFRRNGNFPSMPELYSLPEIVELEDSFFTNQTVGAVYVDSLQELPIRLTAPEERRTRAVFLTALRRVQDEEVSAEQAWDLSVEEARELLSN